MRLLLILAVLVAAFAMGNPSPAQAGEAQACHPAMASDEAAHDSKADDQGDNDIAPLQLAHHCPGCALAHAGLYAAPFIHSATPACPGLLAARLASRTSAPIPPPPRAS